ncbi:four-carbon acid sugar kinase family protein [Streptomyces scopuliridis]|uniref:Four-carbon acid sugar kinase family protein n=1 Tax=Streptomyces scopuliridis TaxID=452529 RepID=A0ACD4ZVV3_9ACTN|nr:four-carbon acid sugar kinase family protein [Streptomyces scopuliridis]WSC02585.1 four-carbon acid sugar kinase family protein [Streptomyces scopuliridis]WSC03883.1 four-carbon acid sugar kinase family protein [Streptomyces scopuliridis]
MVIKPRGGREPCRVLALADDLSGAAETAAALRLPGRIVLGPAPAAPPAEGEALVLDLDTRQLPADEAARIVRETVRGAAAGTVLIKKTDSLLRGNLAAEAAAYAQGAAGLVIAPALPVAGRTVRDGVVHLRGTPLHATDAWRAESGPVPPSVSAALGDLRTAVVPLGAVRSARTELTGRLRDLMAAGLRPVCDAETDEDLDAVVAAVLPLGPDVRLMGTGGLAAALGRVLGPVLDGADVPSPREPLRSDRPLLVVVGTAEPTAVAQIAQLTEAGARHTALPAVLLAEVGPPLSFPVDAHGITVVSVDNSSGILAGSARRVVAGLARAVAALPYPADLVLTGGETARRVLDALGVTRLHPVGQIHHGAVHCRTDDGRSVVTRPGSYGDTGSLLRIARALRPVHPAVPGDHPAVPGVGSVAPVPPPSVSSVPQGEVL